MYRHYNKIMSIVSGLSVGLLYGLRLHQKQVEDLQNFARHGRYTAQEVLSRADQLCPLILPGADIYFAGAHYMECPRLRPLFAHTWSVACQDRSGDAVTHLLWNADTGHLIQVSCATLLQPGLKNNFTGKEAAQSGAEWLAKLGMANTGLPWHLVQPPSRGNFVWHLDFQAGQEKASVVIDSRNASLILARTW